MNNPRLIAISGPFKGKVFPITRETLSVGRNADNTICLVDLLVSGHHFTVVLEDEGAVLYDRETSNGTWIDRKHHIRKVLEHGDRIRCGNSAFIYLEREDALDAWNNLQDELTEEVYRNQEARTLRADNDTNDASILYYKDALKAIGNITASINEIPDGKDLLPRLLDFSFDIVPARWGAILVNRANPSPAAADLSHQVFRERGQTNGPANFGLNSLDPLALQEVYNTKSAYIANRSPAVMCAPLMLSGSMRGVIYMEDPVGRSGFAPEHLQFLGMIAENIVSALRVSGEFETIRNRVCVLEAERESDYSMIGNSAALQRVLEMIEVAAACDLPVLILGETGVGKELVAHAIHEKSRRAHKCFVPVNCPAVSASLFETEFFGHTKGAFTGAGEARQGKFRLADGGTLLLDEIGEMILEMQPKLLRVLQEGEVQPVGAEAPAKVDVRVIAATNVDLAQAVKQHKFRQDLFYRLNAIVIQVPPLRDRRADIPLLVEHFIRRYARATSMKGIAADAMEVLCRYFWPGNIRELENVIRCAVALAGSGGLDTIGVQHLPAGLSAPHPALATPKEQAERAAQDTRKTAGLDMLKETAGNRKLAAKRLGISERTLYYWLGEA